MVPEEVLQDIATYVRWARIGGDRRLPLQNVYLLGFDTEYNPKTKALMSLQFAGVTGQGALVGDLFYSKTDRVTVDEVVDYALDFIGKAGIVPHQIGKLRKHRGKSPSQTLVLGAHFLAAELSITSDYLTKLSVSPVGTSALMGVVDYKDADLRVMFRDTFGYHSCGLGTLAPTFGMQKIDVDRERIDELFRTDELAYRRYAIRDAEIVCRVLTVMRESFYDDYGLDILHYPTAAGLAAAVLRTKYISVEPTARTTSIVKRNRRTAKGWKEQCIKQHRVTDVRLREGAMYSYWGARVEGYTHGFYSRPVREYDVASMYPHAAILQPLPNEKTSWFDVDEGTDIDLAEGFVEVDFLFPRDERYPCLLVHDQVKEVNTWPRRGTSVCTISELRLARDLGASLKIKGGFAFYPEEAEIDHDVGRYMRDFIARKVAATKGSADYAIAKLLMNSLVGKFGQHRDRDDLIDQEQWALQNGYHGVGSCLANSPKTRGVYRKQVLTGPVFVPEWAALILGKARALMGDIVRTTRAHVCSTDSVVVDADADIDCQAVRDLRSVGSDLTLETWGDAFFASRSRTYALLAKDPGKQRVIAADGAWSVVRAARHGLSVSEEDFARAVLLSLSIGRTAVLSSERKRLVKIRESILRDLPLNSDRLEQRRITWGFDGKRKLDRRVQNPWVGYSTSMPLYRVNEAPPPDISDVRAQLDRRRKEPGEAKARLAKATSLLKRGVTPTEAAAKAGLSTQQTQRWAAILKEKP